MLSLPDEMGCSGHSALVTCCGEGTICASLCDTRGHSGDAGRRRLGLLMLGDRRGCPSLLGSMVWTVMPWEDTAEF